MSTATLIGCRLRVQQPHTQLRSRGFPTPVIDSSPTHIEFYVGCPIFEKLKIVFEPISSKSATETRGGTSKIPTEDRFTKVSTPLCRNDVYGVPCERCLQRYMYSIRHYAVRVVDNRVIPLLFDCL